MARLIRTEKEVEGHYTEQVDPARGGKAPLVDSPLGGSDAWRD
jgi:hypothetical protein